MYEAKAATRLRRKAAGICIYHPTVPAAPGSIQCAACLSARSRERRCKNYGLNEAQLDALLLRAGGKCEACQEPLRIESIDHDHATGTVRGVLCTGCNAALGRLEGCPQRLLGLASYLERAGYKNLPKAIGVLVAAIGS